MTLTPMHRTDYRSRAAVLAAFNAGHDFLIADPASPWYGKPVNKPQLAGSRVSIRYDRLRKQVLADA